MKCMLSHKENTIKWIWFSRIRGIGPHAQHELLRKFSDAEEIYHADEKLLSSCESLRKKQIEQILYSRTLEDAKRIYEECMKSGVSILTIKQAKYPHRMKEITDIPVLLYYRGNCILNQFQHAVGMIGARRCTVEGKQCAIDMAMKHSKAGDAIISGMAKGIDSYAHTAALKSNGYTVAVLGYGHNFCYPKEHFLLMKSIEETGMTISQYPPEVSPQQYYFPQRNKLIAALSDELVVIDAGRNSGTQSTVRAAEKYGRPYLYVT